jgi:signal transduction histidine kinase/FixJ family two-component response regulator
MSPGDLKHQPTTPEDERILVAAPFGRDASLLVRAIGLAGMAAVACEARELADAFRAGAGAILLTEEALTPPAMTSLLELLAAEPAWSDVPIVLLIGAMAGSAFARSESPPLNALRQRTNITVLERPVGQLTLVIAIHAALRARRRQYATRLLIEREKEARLEAEAAARAKDDFLATVSHELRTPLSAILLWARLMTRGRLEPAQLPEAFRAVERSALAQSRIVEDLLDATRITSGKLRMVTADTDVSQLAEDSANVVRAAADAKGIALHLDIEPKCNMRLDAERIQQVLWNLLSNAVKFTPSGGHVSLRVARATEHLGIEVADTGQGIAPAFLPHVFERFRQADGSSKRSQTGLGLGLAISWQIIDLHGGTLRAISAGDNRGATFRIELPFSLQAAGAKDAAAVGGPSSTPARTPLDGYVVLLVEDDRDTREALACMLRSYGAVVTAVASAFAALDLMTGAMSSQPNREPPDVLVSDIGMRGMDGHELIARLRAMERASGTPAVPVAVVTAYGDPMGPMLHDDAEIQAFVAKPVDPEQLVSIVARLGDEARTRKNARRLPESTI